MDAIPRIQPIGPVLVSLFVLTVGAAAPVTAQRPNQVRFRIVEDSTVVQEVRLRDGSKLLGHIVAIEGVTIDFVTLGGIRVQFQRRDAERIREIRGVRRGDDFWPEDPSNSRLFVARHRA